MPTNTSAKIWLHAFVTCALVSAASLAADEPPPDDPPQSSVGNLRSQFAALDAYHKQHAHFPAAFRISDAGKPLLSWRVTILPHLGEHKLYAEFRLDEPWDSDRNKPLIAKMPKVFRSPDSKAAAGRTTYMGSGGPTGVIARPPVLIQEIIDGTAATLAIVEVGDKAAVEWTRPTEWIFQLPTSPKDFADLPREDFLGVLCEGTVLRIPKALPPAMLERLFNREEGEPIPNALITVKP